MFTGIVETVGLVETASASELAIRAAIFSTPDRKPKAGDSIAINGVCLTVTQHTGEVVQFDLSTETLRRTNLGALRTGADVNVERALRAGDEIAGHFVLGHIDSVAEVLRCDEEAATIRIEVTIPEEVRGLIVPKGSVCLDGVSLTVGEVKPESFAAYLIPHTVSQTTFRSLQPGRLLNVEADCLARYARGTSEHYSVKMDLP